MPGTPQSLLGEAELSALRAFLPPIFLFLAYYV
jgi:hypothetical protein